MKSRKVDHITSDSEHVRLQIYDGEIPLGEAGGKLLELALAGHHRSSSLVSGLHRVLSNIERELQIANTPWPVRWWRWWRARR